MGLLPNKFADAAAAVPLGAPIRRKPEVATAPHTHNWEPSASSPDHVKCACGITALREMIEPPPPPAFEPGDQEDWVGLDFAAPGADGSVAVKFDGLLAEWLKTPCAVLLDSALAANYREIEAEREARRARTVLPHIPDGWYDNTFNGCRQGWRAGRCVHAWRPSHYEDPFGTFPDIPR